MSTIERIDVVCTKCKRIVATCEGPVATVNIKNLQKSKKCRHRYLTTKAIFKKIKITVRKRGAK